MTSPTSPSPSEAVARPSRLPLVILIVALLLGTVGNLADGFNEDELQHLHAAWLVGHEQVPYRDYFDHHPPLYHFLAAPLASSTGANYGMLFVVARLLAMLIAVGCALLFSRLTPRAAGRNVAIAAGVLLVVSRPSDILFYFRPDSIAMLLVLLAVVMVLGERRTPLSSLAAGISIGTAVFFTQKVLALAPAFVLWQAGAIVLRKQGRKQSAMSLISLLAGIALPVAVVLTALAQQGALRGFMEGPIGFGAHWHQPDTWRKFAQEPVLLGFGAVALGLAWSLRSVGVWLRRGEECWAGDSLIGLLALLGLVGFLRTPAPTPQAYFMTVHVWLLAAAVRMILAYADGGTSVRQPASLLMGVAGALLLLKPANAAAALAGWGLIYAVWRAAARCRPDKVLAYSLTALGTVAALAFAGTQTDRLFRRTAATQLRSLEQIDRLIPPGGQALTTWPVLTPMRPHASYHWFSDIGMYTSMDRVALQTEYLAALGDSRTAIAVCDPSVIRRMVPAVWEKLQRDFEEATLPQDGLRGAHVYVRQGGSGLIQHR